MNDQETLQLDRPGCHEVRHEVGDRFAAGDIFVEVYQRQPGRHLPGQEVGEGVAKFQRLVRAVSFGAFLR